MSCFRLLCVRVPVCALLAPANEQQKNEKTNVEQIEKYEGPRIETKCGNNSPTLLGGEISDLFSSRSNFG